MDDFVINVRQIGNYKRLPHIGATDLLLVQQGGIGGPYACVSQDGLLGQVYQRLNVGILPAPDNKGIISSYLITPLGQRQGFNFYVDEDGVQRYLQNGPAGYWSMVNTGGHLQYATLPPGEKDDQIDPTAWNVIFDLSLDGKLQVGGIVINSPPSAPTDAATVAWVQANTVGSFNGRKGVVTLTLADVNTALGVAAGDAVATHTWTDTEIANALTNFYATQTLVKTFNGRSGAVTLTTADITGAGGAPIASPAFTGTPTAPTPAPGDNSTKIATTAFVTAGVSGALANYAPLNSPAFTGVPTGPTATAGTSTAQLASTAFVMSAINAVVAGVSSFNTRTGAVTLTLADCTDVGVWSSPALTGTPTAPTASVGTATTQLATTAFVSAALAAAVGGVTSFNGRTGVVVLTNSDVITAGAAPLAGPAFTGTPTAPNPVPGDNSQQIATTNFVVTNSVASFNGRMGAVSFQANDISAVGGALLANPAFSGVPTAPTATTGTNTSQIATTAFVAASVAAATAGVASFNGRTGTVTFIASDITGVGGALLASPGFTGTPTAPTASAGTSNTQIATTAFVASAVAAAGGVASFNSRTGAVTLTGTDISNAGGALVNNPTFTGIPAAPTATAGTSTTQIATTAFVATSYAPINSPTLTGTPLAPTATAGTNSQQIATTAFVQGILASPTLTGTPSAPTAAPGTNTTQIATTAFVSAAVTAATTGVVASFNTRTGAVTLTSTDITNAGGALLASPTFTGTPAAPTASPGTSTTQLATTAFVATSFAPLANPTFTGVPAAPTASPGTNTTQLATTAFVAAAVAAGGGSSAIGDVLYTARGTPSSPGTWLPCDGSIQTTATYTTLQGYLGNNFAIFGNQVNAATLNAQCSLWAANLSLWIAAGQTGGATSAVASSTNGTTWTIRENATAGIFWGYIAQNGTTLYVTDGSASSAKTSTNGTSWAAGTAVGLAASETLVGLVVGGTSTLFVAVGNGIAGTTAATIKTAPAAGTPWTARTNPLGVSVQLAAVAASPTMIVALTASGGGGSYLTSPTGATWTSRSVPISGWGTQPKIFYANGFFVITDGGNRFWTSPGTDGLTWTTRVFPPILQGTTGPAMQMYTFGYVAPLFVFYEANSQTFWLTPDFKSWHFQATSGQQSTPIANNAVTGNAGQIVWGDGSEVSSISFTNTTTQFRLPDMNNLLYGGAQLPAYIRAL